MITIAIANQKGGTGKTTTAVTLGHRLALDGYRVLLVDTDVQGHVAAALGLDKAPGIYRLVQHYQGVTTPGVVTPSVGQPLVVQARPNLDVIPSDKSTEPAKRILVSMDFRERILADTLAAFDHAVAIIDCAPSVDVLHVAALVAADWLIVPTKLDYLAVDGVNEVIGSLAEIQRRSPENVPRVLGILPTFYDRKTNETLAQLRLLVDTFGARVLPPVPVDVKLREAPAYGQTIWEYAPKARSVLGMESANGKVNLLGGYQQFVERIEEAIGL